MRIFLFTVVAVFIGPVSFSQNIAGSWQGKIDANGQQILIVFHFYKDSTGRLTGKWDCPPQNAKNLPCSDVTIKNDSVIIGLKIISGSYEGKLIKTDSIAGLWHQGNAQLPLNIVRTGEGTAFVQPKRPQTPKAPFDYDVKEVVYSNADNTIHYGATFTKPSSPAGTANNMKYPTVLLITGSGKQDRDENVLDHKPFAVIADFLTKRGIAVLRVDDRGMGQTTGDFDTSSSEDFAKDVEAGITYLESRADVDKKHVGLIGHSEGGMIAPMVAARDKEVSFIVMLAGTAVSGAVINDYQNVWPLRQAGLSEEIIKQYLDLHHALVGVATSAMNEEDYKDEVSKIYADWKKKQSPATLDALIKQSDEQTISVLQRKYGLFHSKWWKFFLLHDPSGDLEKLTIPVLALNGEKDIQVDPHINLPAIESALKKSKSTNYKTLELPGLNHLFQHCTKCTIEEYGEIEETFSPEALKIMGDWISGVVRK